MHTEIERKFLVRDDRFLSLASDAVHISQGYLSIDPARTVRVRIAGDSAYLTIKGLSNADGTSRLEAEYAIPVDDARGLMDLCLPGKVEKTRYRTKESPLIFEVDVFHGENEGLILAEVELPHADFPFVRPDWIDIEVTGDERYYNAWLSRHPFTKWPM